MRWYSFQYEKNQEDLFECKTRTAVWQSLYVYIHIYTYIYIYTLAIFIAIEVLAVSDYFPN